MPVAWLRKSCNVGKTLGKAYLLRSQYQKSTVSESFVWRCILALSLSLGIRLILERIEGRVRFLNFSGSVVAEDEADRRYRISSGHSVRTVG